VITDKSIHRLWYGVSDVFLFVQLNAFFQGVAQHIAHHHNASMNQSSENVPTGKTLTCVFETLGASEDSSILIARPINEFLPRGSLDVWEVLRKGARKISILHIGEITENATDR